MSASTKAVAFRIRARRLGAGDQCLFCAYASAEGHSQRILALTYFLGHRDEALLTGPPLCETCLRFLSDIAERITVAHGGGVYDMNAPGGGKA
jgi:hypothetical protein